MLRADGLSRDRRADQARTPPATVGSTPGSPVGIVKNVELFERDIADAEKTVDFAGLDDENVSRASLVVLSVDSPSSTALPHKHDLIVGMPMAARSAPGCGIDEVR